jgi:hypothetical protein
MQVLGFSSTTREDLILKLLSCFINPLHLCAVHFARIDPIDPVQLSDGLEGTCGNDDGCGQGLRLWNCIGFYRMLQDVALVFLDVHSGCILDLRWGPNHD